MPFDFAVLKQSFFDSAKVMNAVDAADRRAQSKMGAFIRRRARSSIRKRKGSSPPGKPPSSHAGQLKLIFFAWDAAEKATVVGPAIFTGGRRQAAPAPKLLEHSGAVTVREKTGHVRRPHYRGNPFMAPALAAELPKFTDAFKGELR